MTVPTKLAATYLSTDCGSPPHKSMESRQLMKNYSSENSAIKTVEIERDGLNDLIAYLSSDIFSAFDRTVDLIALASGRTILTGMGKSGHIARKIAATMASTGTPALFIHPAEASHGDLGMVQANDNIIALSWSGETTELSALVSYAKRFRVPLIAITSNPESTLGRQADICINLPKSKEACPNGLAPTTSTTMQLALGDAISIALLERRGFSPSQFSVFHPGGKLGSSLVQAREIMHSGPLIPIVHLKADLREILLEIDSKGFGSVIVVDSNGLISGIITDGDLRRNLQKQDLRKLYAYDIMNSSPIKIRKETLLAEILANQENNKITTLIVEEHGKPIGIVHYHDLLKAGVI